VPRCVKGAFDAGSRGRRHPGFDPGRRPGIYALDGTATAGDLVSRLAEVAALRDISVLEPTIDDVVARLYTRPPS
jgi:hypothetical protein